MEKLHDILSRAASDAVKLQRTFNRAFEEDCNGLLPHLQEFTLAEEWIKDAVLPRRMTVKEYEFNCSLQLEMNKETGVNLGWKQIPLKFAYLLKQQALHQQTINIRVEQLRLTENPYPSFPKT